MIRKEVFVNDIVLGELQRIIEESAIMKEDDRGWPQPDKVGKQELEIKIGGKKREFETSKFGSYSEVTQSSDPEGLTKFWYLIQDIKCFVLSLVNAHFRVSKRMSNF